MTKFTTQSLPVVRVVLCDIEQEERDKRKSFGIPELEGGDPLGLEFRFEAFNASGDRVCFGKIDNILDKQVTVRKIETEINHRRSGYGTSVVLELSKHFGGLPIVPMDERGDGPFFWDALRKNQMTADLVKEQIGLTEASSLLRQAEADARQRL